jgi:hypothetical protein
MGELPRHAAHALFTHEETESRSELVAGQLGHTVHVNLNVYTQSPVESRLVIVNQLESLHALAPGGARILGVPVQLVRPNPSFSRLLAAQGKISDSSDSRNSEPLPYLDLQLYLVYLINLRGKAPLMVV